MAGCVGPIAWRLPLARWSDRSAERVLLYIPEHDGFATLALHETHAASYVAGASAIDVTTRTFDDWLAASSIKVALMKIDVEGAEMSVLAGMRTALAAGRVRRVILETGTDSAAHRLLVNQGFRPSHIESVGPVDNIAYAFGRSA
jgi:hypothetical protein